MSKKHLSPKTRQRIRSAKRRAKRGANARCARCEYAEPTALQTVTLCYECAAWVQGQSPVEQHHPFGRSNDPSRIGVPGNPHRVFSDRMQDWESELQHGDPADPLLWIARLLRSLKDAAEWVVDRADDLIHFLLRLRQWLIENHGAQWWKELGLGPLWGSA